MKISKIFAGMSAMALAASMLSMVSVSADEAISNYEIPAEYFSEDGNTAYLVGEEAKGEAGPFESVAELTSVTSIKFVVSIDEDVAQSGISAETWLGGGLGTNSDTSGWNSHEWCFQPYATDADGNPVDEDGDGNPDPVKECTFEKVSDGVYETVYTSDDAIFYEDDTYAQVWLQDWAACGITVTSIILNPTDDADDEASASVSAVIGFADGDWSCQDWATTIDVVNGENTLVVKAPLGEDGTPMTSEGITVFVIDLVDCFAEMPDLTCEVTSITLDGVEYEFDGSKILYGNLEDDTDNYRIEIYNAYGNTTVGEAYDESVSPVNPADFIFSDEMVITFTASGIVAAADDSSEADSETSEDETSESEDEAETSDSEDEASDSEDDTSDSSTASSESSSSKATSTSTTTNPSTGAAALAAVGVALAGAAVVASKKRK